MAEIKKNFTKGRMNLDLDDRLLPQGEYREALNIQISGSEDSDVGSVKNILGNTLSIGTNNFLSAWNSDAICIGSIADEKNDRIYWLVTTYGNTISANRYSAIIRYNRNTNSSELVFVDKLNEVLKFDTNNYITGINIVDDFLFFTDGVSEPKKINIPVCISGTTSLGITTTISGVTATEEHVTVIKKKPTRAPEIFLVRQDAPTNFGEFDDFTFLGVSVDDSVTLTITTASARNINANDILLLSDPNEQGSLPTNAQVRLKVTTSTHVSSTQTIVAEVVFIDSSTTSDTIQFDYLVEDLEDVIFEKVFPRFGYRYKYRDGEYSAFSPFTDVAFSPRDFNIHPTKEPYNKGMETNVKTIRLSQFVPYDIPEDVVSVDLLYKSDNDPTIYSIETIKPTLSDGTNNPAWHNVSASSSTIDIQEQIGAQLFNNVFLTPSHTGYYEISSDNIHVVLPENQLLRLYDNVPKKALAQDFTANRLIYGNYTQNLELGSFDNNIDLDYEVRTNVAGQSIQFVTGEKSVKSLKTYKAGIVFGDKYGRETSVFTGSKTSSLKIPFEQHENSNRLVFKNLTNVIGQDNTNTTLDPYYFKAYIKETSAEYYNLVVDRVYKTKEDDNLWVSFPSSDRNKVKEDDYIILKKSLDSDDAITSDNKFKIIDIQSNAPDFIKIKYQELATVDSPSDITLLFFDSSFQPAPAFDKIKISKEVTDVDGLPNIADLAGSGKRISLKFQLADGPNNTLHSDRYNALSVSFVDSSPEHYVITLDKPIENQDSWVEVSEGVLEPNLKITFFVDEQKDWEEFQGRFFVKIVANDVSDEFLESQIGTVTQQAVVARTRTFFLGDSELFDVYKDLVSDIRINTTNHNTTFGQSDTKVKWEDNLDFGESSAQPSWFIDNCFVAAAQPTIVTDTSITTPSGSPYFEPYSGNVPDNDVSVSGSLFASRHPSYSSGNSPTFVNNGLGTNFTFYPRFGGYVDGLEGIVDTSNGDFCPDPAEVGTFGDAAIFAPRALLTQVAGEYDQAYGPPGHTGIFMHLSFSPVGVDLHDGVNLLKDGSKNNRNGLVLNLQGINNFNQQHENYTTNDTDIRRGSYYDDNGNPHSGYSLLSETVMNKYGVCDAPQDSSLMIEETANQWNPVFNHPENQAIVDNLKIGSKFKFVNDTNDTIFTIKRVTVKRFYNHTAWNYRNIWNGTNLYNSQADGERFGDTTTVHSAWSRWVKDPRGGSTNTQRFEELEDAVKRFGAADNRRVTYILELDKDPRIECSVNPETLALDTNTHIHFLKPYVSENSTVLSDNPAVFETEPRENTELDIYYEASNAIPLKLDDESSSNVDNDKGYILAPIGSKVTSIFPSGAQYANTNEFNTPLVKAWDGDILELHLGLKVDSTTGSTEADQSVSWADKKIKIYRDDSSYIEMEVASTGGVVEVDNSTYGGATITKFKLKPSVFKVGLPYFNCYSFGNGVESNRIRDDFNQPFISNGVKVSTTLEEGYEVDNRTNGLIYSGLYNKNAKVNNLNQFIAAEKITKDLLPTYGSIQKLYARNSDLVALCEDKVVQILADKDALFNADGNMQLVSTNKVLGQSRPFVGDYGISKNPESFAAEGYRAYFTDKQRGAVLRLSMDGLTAISEAGMKDYFGDKLKGSYNNILGSYDKDKDHYNVTFNFNNEDYDSEKTMYDITNPVTVSYKESIKGWSSFKSFVPESGISLAGDYYTFKTGRLYRHDNETRNAFYSPSSQNSFINVLINDSPLVIKDFKTLNYDGDDGWFCSEITTDAGVKAEANNFVNRENKYFSIIKGLKQEDIKTNELNFQGIGFSTQIRKIQWNI